MVHSKEAAPLMNQLGWTLKFGKPELPPLSLPQLSRALGGEVYGVVFQGKDFIIPLKSASNGSRVLGLEHVDRSYAEPNISHTLVSFGQRRVLPWFWQAGFFNLSNVIAGVLLSQVAPLADKQGYLDLDALSREQTGGEPHIKYRSDIKNILGRVFELTDRGRRMSLEGISHTQLFNHANDQALRALVAGERILPAMRAFDRLVGRHRRNNQLQGIRIFAHQHLLGSIGNLLLKGGMTPASTTLWGKNYSLDPRMASRLYFKGFEVRGTSIRRDRKWIRAEIKRTIKQQVSQLEAEGALTPEGRPRDGKPRVLILDDGGELIAEVAGVLNSLIKKDKRYEAYAELFSAVEQTTRGLTRLREMQNKGELPISVVSVADSWAKTKYGSGIFGHAVSYRALRLVQQVEKQLSRDTKRFKFPREAALLGAGNIGWNAMRLLLDKGWNLHVYDKSLAVRMRLETLAQEYGKGRLQVYDSKQRALQDRHLLISTVGRRGNVTERDLGHLADGAMVVNGASADEIRIHYSYRRKVNPAIKTGREASSSWQTYGKLLGKPIILGMLSDMNGHEIWSTDNDKQILLARSGGVINFPLELTDPDAGKPIPGRYIQLEVGLLHLALKQAAHGGPKGVQSLHLEPQKEYVEMINHDLARYSLKRSGPVESLDNPRF